MPPTLAAGRLSLLPAVEGDLDWLHGLLGLQEVRRYLCDDTVLGRDRVAKILAESLALPDGLGMWRLELSDGCRVGFTALQPVSETAAAAMPAFAGEIEPIVAVDPRHWGRGHARSAQRAVMACAFDVLDQRQVVAMVDEPNERSHRMIAGAGFDMVGSCMGPAHVLRCYRAIRPS